MEENKRIRLIFKDDDILSQAQKSDGLNRSWVMLKPHQHHTVSHVASYLLHAFQLHQSCPDGLLLSMSGFVLPPFESTYILKDNEIIRVQKKRDILSIAGNDTTNEVKKLKAVEKQPVDAGVLLLANEEFEKEKGGYESGDPEDEFEDAYEQDLLEHTENPSGGNADPKNRKRKAPEKLQGSKKKKRRSEATGALSDKKRHSSEEKNDDSNVEDSVENSEKTALLSDKKRNVEVQENGKETEDVNIAPKETKKVPSRSARRKYAKRRWLREMANIQKKNATCESEGLRNWKEDQAKAGRKKVDGQLKVQQKWRKHQVDAEKNEDDGQPKGLLHLKLSPQKSRPVNGKRHQQRNKTDYFPNQVHKRSNQNGYGHEQPTQNVDGHEQPIQNVDGLEQPNQKHGDVQEQPDQKSAGVQELPNQICDASEQFNQESDEENEVVPIVIRPGHIRFEPLGKEQAVQQNHVPMDTFQWNGITSKKKGQQWGKENRSFTPRNDYKLPDKVNSQILSSKKENQPDEGIDFDKLPPLPSIPKEGDLIVYRVLELSSSWTPELSAFRVQVGKVSCYDAESNQTILAPVPEYPIVSKKFGEDEDAQPDSSLYKEDGSLEIDFSTLIDVRIFNKWTSGPGNEALSLVSEGSIDNEVLPSRNDKQTVVPSPETLELNQGKETQPPTAEIGGTNIWDEVSEALSAKKEQLYQENGWAIPPKKAQLSQKNIWGRNAKKVQPSMPSSLEKNAQKVQPLQDSSWDKQSSGGKSWSYKGLRGGGLASTMAFLRASKDKKN